MQVLSTALQMIHIMHDTKLDGWTIEGLFESVPSKLSVICLGYA